MLRGVCPDESEGTSRGSGRRAGELRQVGWKCTAAGESHYKKKKKGGGAEEIKLAEFAPPCSELATAKTGVREREKHRE